ncbi:MAG: IMP dehydrogenase [Candidatus Aenigmarchaeota archaeon]|nr:IMP dehydrogenase [Candidatus Aenigmarchaeota archaeon]
MAKQVITKPGFTYDDLVLHPDRIRKGLDEKGIDLRSPITSYRTKQKVELAPDELPKDTLILNNPLTSSPMQSVTGPEMAIEVARHGGLGVIFCSQPLRDEAEMVEAVKRHKAGFVVPDVFSPESSIDDVIERARETGYSTFPVTHKGKTNGRLIGLITQNDFSERIHRGLKVHERMKPLSELQTASYEELGYDLRQANDVLEESHHGSLAVVDRHGRLRYMVFKKDLRAHREHPEGLVDDDKRYMVGAAVNTHDYRKRVPALVKAGADILFIDASQGYSDYQADALRYIKKLFPKVPVVGGNIVTEDGFDFLAENGADAVKVGMGPGSICTTRQKFKMGRAQATAVFAIDNRRQTYMKKNGIYVPIIADGGIVTNDNIAIALALGADAIMAGRFFARFHESPTKIAELKEERGDQTYVALVKPYWGEGSARAKAWRQKRYGQSEEEEGIEGYAPYIGHVSDALPLTLRHIRLTLQKAGYRNLRDFHVKADLEMERESTKREGRPHDIIPSGMWADYKTS